MGSVNYKWLASYLLMASSYFKLTMRNSKRQMKDKVETGSEQFFIWKCLRWLILKVCFNSCDLSKHKNHQTGNFANLK